MMHWPRTSSLLADKAAVTTALTGVFQDVVAKGVQNISFGDFLADLGINMYKFKFRIPSYFSLVIRSLAVLEGIAISYDPNYKVLGSTYPWIARKVLTDSSPKLKSTLRALLYKDGKFRIDRLESLISESLRARKEKTLTREQSDFRESRFIFKQVLVFALNKKVTFLREVLLDELAKGLDALGLATFDSITTVSTNLALSSSYSFSLMTDEDIVNLRNLQRLILFLQGLDKRPGMGELSNRAPFSLAHFGSAQELLSLLSVIAELPQDMQQELVLRLPTDLAGKVASRVAARTLRRILL
ncbi:unnamed protein product [Cuscuta epithymum]|uniref:Uncharacterized protein n=1 Tax=Cuscuta epithymum TaxID=186058 RepID=A0AAV0EZY7_9ASTE|nr:unnamed protein product [Cuscuta epithymum]